jgi:membrane protease YdiL (CAAX protease family)
MSAATSSGSLPNPVPARALGPALLRLVLFLVVATLFGAGGMLVVLRGFGYQPQAVWAPVDFVLSEGIQLLGVLGAAAVLARIERRRLRDYGLPLEARGMRDLLAGTLWGLVFVALLVGAIALFGGVRIAGLASPSVLVPALEWALAMLLLGLFEEALFRGYALVSLSEAAGFWPASLALSVFFGALHFFTKPHETWIDAVSVGLIGLFLCITVRRTRALWWAVGFHAAFDFAALVLFASPNSGNDGKSVAGHVLAASYGGSDWLTGGACGIEASALILPLLAGLFLAFARVYRGKDV